MSFDKISGQELPLRQLKTTLAGGHIAHAYLFSGIEGVGKFSTAVCLAKALNCAAREADFCGECLSCRKIEKRLHPDVFFIEPDREVIRIEQVRDLQKKIIFKPMEGRRKVVVIDQAEKLNMHAANCLLKTLEEPPEDTVIILVAHAAVTLLPTIVSRCQRIRFAPLADSAIMEHLAGRGAEHEEARLAAVLAQGSLKRALELRETDFLAKRRKLVEHVVRSSTGTSDSLFQLARVAAENQEEIPRVLEFLQTWYRDLLLLADGLPEKKLYNQDVLDKMHEALQRETRQSILHKAKKLQWIYAHGVLNINYTLAFESMFMQSAHL
jgi:DNA polymerase III subunit delta'